MTSPYEHRERQRRRLAKEFAGPCGFCGTRTARRSPEPVSWSTPDVTPGFETHHGQPACAWCAYFLSSRTLTDFRELLFNAVAGTLGTPVVGNYRHDDNLVPFANELGYAGAPFGYFNEDRKWAIRARAYAVVHRSRFCTTEAQTRTIAVPGIAPTVWPVEALPNHGGKVFRPLGDAIAWAEEQQALEERRKREEHAKAINRANRNKQLDEMTTRDERVQAATIARARELGVL